MVKPFVLAYHLNDYMIQADTTIDQWCTRNRRTGNDNRPNGASSTYVNNGNNYVWGFEASDVSGSEGQLRTDSWEAGDPYGIEIARVDLPKGYIFGGSKPESDTLESASVKAVNFDPEEFEPQPNPANVPVSAVRQGDVKKVDTVTKGMLDDRNQ